MEIEEITRADEEEAEETELETEEAEEEGPVKGKLEAPLRKKCKRCLALSVKLKAGNKSTTFLLPVFWP